MRSGDVVANRYRLDSEIGAGLFTRVFLANDLQLARHVAVKIFLLPESERLTEAIGQAAAFHHSGALTILDRGVDEHPYLVTEYCPGGTLGEEIAAMGPLGSERVAGVAIDACAVLGSAHDCGLLHRGLKPSNILFDSSDRLKIADFGLSLGSDDVTLAPGSLPAYTAPEQAAGETLTPATDLFALGVILAEAVSGGRVVARSSGIAVMGHGTYRPNREFICDGSLRDTIERATRLDPAERFQCADDMAASIRGLHPPPRAISRPTSALQSVGGSDPTPAAAVGLLERPADDEITSGFAWPSEKPASQVVPSEDATDVEDVWDEVFEPPVVADEPKPRRHRKWPLILVLLLLIAGGVTFVVPNYTKRAPDLLGLTLDGARTQSEALGIRSDVVATVPSGVYAKGTVVGQSPPPNGRLGFRSPVRLTLSSGPPPVAVPSVKGSSIQQATRALQGVGLVPVVVGAAHSGEDPGQVLSQDPAETVAESGSSVLLTISSGPEPAILPDLAGKAAKDAESELLGLRVQVTQEQENSDTVKAGSVISTVPASGATVRSGHPVKLVVSKGPRTIPVPDVRGSRVTDATAKLQALGFTVKLVQIVGQDRVVSQDPPPGSSAKKGQTITLTTGS